MLPALVIFPFLQLLDVLRWRRENDLQCQVMYIVNQHTHTHTLQATGSPHPLEFHCCQLSLLPWIQMNKVSPAVRRFCSSVAHLQHHVYSKRVTIFSFSVCLSFFVFLTLFCQLICSFALYSISLLPFSRELLPVIGLLWASWCISWC